MKTLQRVTPCVGICSTTYGDLVCRGCKRFSHEVVQWNGYTQEQRSTVWQRLFEIRAAAVSTAVQIDDQQKFESSLQEFELPIDTHWPVVAYELLRRVVRKDQQITQFGLVAKDPGLDTLALLRQIDGDIYVRAQAHYEHSYRVPAQ